MTEAGHQTYPNRAFLGVMDAPLVGALVIAALLGGLFLIFQAKSDEYQCQSQVAQYQTQANDGVETAKPNNSLVNTSQQSGKQSQQPHACQAETGFAYYVLSFLRRIARLMRRYSELVTALFTGVLTAFTAFLWVSTKHLWESAKSQGEDFKAQLAIARDDFTSTHRPWMKFDTKIGQKGVWYDAEGLHIAIEFQCENTGSTPAIGVSVNARAYLWSPVGDELEQQKNICTTMHPADMNRAGGITIFPSANWKFTQEYLIPKVDLDAIQTVPKNIVVTISGCVDYLFSFGKLESHQSRFIYYLGGPAPELNKVGNLIEVNGKIPDANLRLLMCRLMNAFRTT